MTCLERLETYLRESWVPFRVEHHHRATTAHQVALSEQIPDGIMAKVVMVFADDQLTMLVIPADRYVEPGHIAAALDAATVRLAHEEEFAPVFPDCQVGAMPPFGHLYGVPVYLDTALTDDTVIIFQAGTHTEVIAMAVADYLKLAQPTVRDLYTHTAAQMIAVPA